MYQVYFVLQLICFIKNFRKIKRNLEKHIYNLKENYI